MPEQVDIAVVGAGAAGLFAAIHAGRAGNRSVVALDGARKLGAKILVAGGGRCNVTHDQVDASAFAGGSRNAIRKVLLRYDVPQTIDFFRDYGVTLKREETGKLFPTTDSARTILDALLRAAREAGVALRHPWRVESISREADGFHIRGSAGELNARCVILATGGRSLPKTGSDGHGYMLARALGHTLTKRIFPALVPLTLPSGYFLTALSGITVPMTLEVVSATGKRLVSFTDSTLMTHFGLSGPSVLDISRYYTDALFDDPDAKLLANWLPGRTTEQVEADLPALGRSTPLRYLSAQMPDRLARALADAAGVDITQPGQQMSKAARRALATALTALPLPVTGNRGYTYAEVTAGGVPLNEIRLETMESRVCPGLFLCGELLDVDGRIGGYNFQWAWASGFVAGTGATTDKT